MGIYDRDWWRERYNQRTDRDEKTDSAWRRPASEQADAVRNATYNPKAHRQPRSTKESFQHVPRNPKNRPPNMPGADWHWTVKLIVFAAAMTVILIAAKHLAPLIKERAASHRTAIKIMK